MKLKCCVAVAAVVLLLGYEAVASNAASENEADTQDMVMSEYDMIKPSSRELKGLLGSKFNLHKKKAKKAKKDKKMKKKSKKHNKSKKSDEGKECGVNYCGANQISQGGMKTCLKTNFDHLSNLYFPEDSDGYLEARKNPFLISRFPAAIVYVENVEEVQNALACAVNNGYKVSPRGGGHSFQGLSTMDGYVVIDMGRTCKPDEFIVDKTDKGPHILEGSRYVGTIKAQSGCTNAIMLAAGAKYFEEEAGMTLIGSCPSVGLTGFVLGGGGGDISPYVGYGVDIVKAFQLVLYNGTVVTASEEENSDLFWASRGGSGGNGVITHLAYKIIEAPAQKYEHKEGKKYTFLHFSAYLKDLEKGAKRIQDWFYDIDPKITGKFGGGFEWKHKTGADSSYFPDSIVPPSVNFRFVYLGSWKEAIEELKMTGLIDHDLFQFTPSSPFKWTDNADLVENYEILCNSSLVTNVSSCQEYKEIEGAVTNWFGDDREFSFISAYQFDSYAESELFHICISGIMGGNGWFIWTRTSGNFCKDFGIDDDKCEDAYDDLFRMPYRPVKSCLDKDVINAMSTIALDPASFLNSHGPSVELFETWAPYFTELVDRDIEPTYSGLLNWVMDSDYALSRAGSNMFQRFDDSFFAKILNETTESANHLQHAAGLQVHPDETAYPWRNAALMIEHDTMEGANSFNERLLEGGYKPQGYYAYLAPPSIKNWRSYYFDDKWQKLSKIRAKYDPKDVFGKPYTIESIGE